jgi:hypothetical protein
METASAWTALYLAARSTTIVAGGKLQHAIPRIGVNSGGDFSPFTEVKLHAGVRLPARPSILPNGSTWRMINNNVFGERVVHFRNIPVVKSKVETICKTNE